ncbi:cytochrome c oxidase assembly factor 2 [[Candida] anglica]|uniref:Cytochrome c oxidase assembly factor 2 n=1 Tax=[Candida] anglica TaxID=148631 RepID=A0ABP0EG38_9ASCO
MFASIRATQRNRLTNSLFTSTFAVCFILVGANSLVPCPIDSVHGNDSVIDERLKRHQKEADKQ